MDRTSLITAVAAAVIAAAPAMAQPGRGGEAAPPDREETVPLRLKAGQVSDMQQRLNERGFSAGHVDGLWGPDTSAAVRNFQQKNGLRATGQLDRATLRALGITAAAAPVTAAQNATTPAPTTGNPPGTAAGRAVDRALGTNMTGANPGGADAPDGTRGNPPSTAVGRAVDRAQGQTPQPDGTPGNPPGTAAGRAMDRALGTNTTGTNPGGTNAGQSAAGGDSNQPVATTGANAAQPAHGANSFTMGEAQRRIADSGYQNVSGLRKDGNGVWRGTATKNGGRVNVWLDYKGNVGQQ